MKMPIEIPYGAAAPDLYLETGCEDALVEHELELIIKNHNDEEAERICRAAVVLKAKFPTASFGTCLCTALLYEQAL